MRVASLVLISFLLGPQSFEAAYAGSSRQKYESLLDKYGQIEKELDQSPLALPFYIESAVSEHDSQVDIYGRIKYSLPLFENELQVPANWCDILLLHNYVRACTYQKVNDSWLLTIYNVSGLTDPLAKADRMRFRYHIFAQHSDFFDVSLEAPEGPFHTKDHQFAIEALSLDDNRLLIHVRYSFRYGSLGYLAMESYLSIFGRGKVGFSIIGTDNERNPIYVNGLRGATERNAVRYYLAILAYMDTLKIPREQRFQRRLNQWYDLTARFRRQLFEMEKEEYFTYKRRDQENQAVLQSSLTQ